MRTAKCSKDVNIVNKPPPPHGIVAIAFEVLTKSEKKK